MEFCKKKNHKHTAPTTSIHNFHSGPLFSGFSQCGGFYDHSLRFPIDFIWSLSPFNSLVSLPFVFRRITQYSDNIFVSKFGFKTLESPLNFDKITFDDSVTRQERRRKTLPRNYTHPKKSMVHATFCSLMLERYAQVSVWRQTTGWFWLHQFRKSVWFPNQEVDRMTRMLWKTCFQQLNQIFLSSTQTQSH